MVVIIFFFFFFNLSCGGLAVVVARVVGGCDWVGCAKIKPLILGIL